LCAWSAGDVLGELEEGCAWEVLRKDVVTDGALVEGEDVGMRSYGGRKAADSK